ncbi:MAG: hypothetical protein QNK03_26580 [Myxococcota bacterium]|nr:hypothetical protein [Myxococcota bacterium]
MARPDRRPLSHALLLCLAAYLAPAPALAAADRATPLPAREATLPLDEVLRLYRENAKAKEPDAPGPPVAATVQRLEMSGRVLDRAVEIEARIVVEVLADAAWVSVPLLGVGEGMTVRELPRVAKAVLTTHEGGLVLLTRHRGRYDFRVTFVQAAAVEGDVRSARIGLADATLVALELSLDERVFAWMGSAPRGVGDAFEVTPRDGAFELAWRRVTPAAPEGPKASKPRAEPVVPRVHASTVSTLEGKRITRLLYELQFAGDEEISFELPDGQTLERVYLHGQAIPARPDDGTLRLPVRPKRAGDEGGVLEIVLTSTGKSYHLSGDLDFEFPRASWPVNELFVALSLPPVFNYTWTGGSLAPIERCDSPDFSYRIPAPGKRLAFHQYLVHASAPKLSVGYDVDLEGHYFRP